MTLLKRLALILALLVAVVLLTGCERAPQSRAVAPDGTALTATDHIAYTGLDDRNVNRPSAVRLTFTDSTGAAREVAVTVVYSNELLYTYVQRDGTLTDRARRELGEQLRKALIPESLRDAANSFRGSVTEAEVLVSNNRHHYLGRRGKDTFRLVVPTDAKLALTLLTLPGEGMKPGFVLVLKSGNREVRVPADILE
jgi:hypothetical protein